MATWVSSMPHSFSYSNMPRVPKPPTTEQPTTRVTSHCDLEIRGSSNGFKRNEHNTTSYHRSHTINGPFMSEGHYIGKRHGDVAGPYVGEAHYTGKQHGDVGERKYDQVTNGYRTLGWPPAYLQQPNSKTGYVNNTEEVPPRKVSSLNQLESVIKEKLTAGYYGIRHMFLANDATGQGHVSREGLLRILYSLCGYISVEQFNMLLKRLGMEKKQLISFDLFLSAINNNSTVNKDLMNPNQKFDVEELKKRSYQDDKHKRADMFHSSPYNSAAHVYSQLKIKANEGSFDATKLFPPACFQFDGRILPPQLREALAHLGMHLQDDEFEKLWARYDQNNCGAIMTHNFLRILGLTSYGRVQPSPPKGNFQMNFSHRRNHSDIVRSRTIRTEVIQVEEEVKETRADQFAMRSVQNNQFTKAGKELFNLDEKMAKAEAQVRYIKQKTTRQSLTESVTDSLRYKFEAGYSSLLSACALFDFMDDGYISRADLCRVLDEFGFNISALELEQFLARGGLRAIRGQINYRDFLSKYQNKGLNSVQNKITNKYSESENGTSSMDSLTATELKSRLLDYFHGDYIALVRFFRSCDKHSSGIIAQDDFRMGVDQCLGYKVSDPQWEQVRTAADVDGEGLMNYPRYLQQYNTQPAACHATKEGSHTVHSMTENSHTVHSTAENSHTVHATAENSHSVHATTESSHSVKQSNMVQSSAIEKSLEKVDMTCFQPKVMQHMQDQRTMTKDRARTLPELAKLLEDFFRTRFHTFDKHFKDMDRKMTGRMSKWQFGTLMKQCGVPLKTSELDRLWATLKIASDGMFSYNTLIQHFMLNLKDAKNMQPYRGGYNIITGEENTLRTDTCNNKILEQIRQIESQHTESKSNLAQTSTQRMVQEQTTRNVKMEQTDMRGINQDQMNRAQTGIVETRTVSQEKEEITNIQTEQTEIRTVHQGQAWVQPRLRPQSATQQRPQLGIKYPTRPQSAKPTYDVISKMRSQVVANWDQLRTLLRYLDKSDSAVITATEMEGVLDSLNFALSKEEKKDLCSKFDLNKNGRFHYMPFMREINAHLESKPRGVHAPVFCRDSQNTEDAKTNKFVSAWFSQSPDRPIKAAAVQRIKDKLLQEWKPMRRAFKRLDTNNKGYVDVLNFKKIMKSCGIPVTDEDLFQIVNEFDQGLEGRIFYDEFLHQSLCA